MIESLCTSSSLLPILTDLSHVVFVRTITLVTMVIIVVNIFYKKLCVLYACQVVDMVMAVKVRKYP